MDPQGKDRAVAACRLSFGMMYAIALMLIAPLELRADSLASKNAKGNRLFAQEKYGDAEKAYLEAQVKDPGKPEILYNLGNSLIKQKKFTQGIQSLRQSIDKGDKGTRENGWYNTGNALYSMGNYKESADAYIQALKLDPNDMDAKHNLELALLKLQQQKQQKHPDKNQDKQNSEQSNQNQSSGGKSDNQGKQPQNERAGSSSKNSQSQRPDTRREGSISKEQAAQILDAVQNQELEQQRRLLEGRARRKTNEKDW